MLGIHVFLVVGLIPLATSALKRPNIIFIIADDLGYNDIGYHARLHESDMKTPYLDKLARNGIKLENYYVQPICTPSRSQLMSSRYQIHTGLQSGVIMSGQRNGLPLDLKIIPEHLKDCGYDTHMVGKWHLGFYKKEYMPQYRGFNSYFGYLNGAETYFTHVTCSPPGVCGVDMRSEQGPTNDTWGTYSAHLFANKAKEVIDKRDKSKPLFLYLSYQSVHFPMEVPDSYVRPFMHIKDKTRRTYAGMLAALDESVMNVTEHLYAAGIRNETIIIFTTDNGGRTDFGGNNWPLRGQKATLWEGGIKGVGFVTGNPLGVSNVENKKFVHISDWLPTLLTATNCPKLNGTQPFDGFDQWKTIVSNKPSPRVELLHNINPRKKMHVKNSTIHGFDVSVHAAIRKGPWKLLTGDPGFSEWVKPPESGKFEVFENKNTKKPLVQLYHIDTDPYERYDIAIHFPNVVTHLLERLVAYNKTAVPSRYPKVDGTSFPKYHGGFWGPWVT